MPSLAAAKAANSSVRLGRSVALFVGGTAGIGQAAAQTFARYANGNAHIILCGRSEAAALETIATFPKSADAKYEFLQCDVARLANVSAACKRLKEQNGLTKLNYLFMSPGYWSMFGGPDDTGEGLDMKFALHFYSRFKFFTELAPLLQNAKAAGEEARVVSVLAAAGGNKLDTSDIGLKRTYSSFKLGRQGPTYNDLMVEALARRYPDLGFIHAYPGAVKTSLWTGSAVGKVLGVVAGSLLIQPADCGEWMNRALLDPAMRKGAFHMSQHGDLYPPKKLSMLSAEDEETVYNHFIEVSSKY